MFNDKMENHKYQNFFGGTVTDGRNKEDFGVERFEGFLWEGSCVITVKIKNCFQCWGRQNVSGQHSIQMRCPSGFHSQLVVIYSIYVSDIMTVSQLLKLILIANYANQ